jgi:ATP-dependent helicase HrpB
VAAIRQCERTGRDETPFGKLLRGPLRSIQQSAQQIRQLCDGLMTAPGSKAAEDRHPSDGLQRTLLVGFPDRLAKRRASGKSQGLMVGGKGVSLAPQSGVMDPELFLCIDIEHKPGDAIVRQASRIDRDWLQGKNRIEREELFFHPTQKQVVARRRTLWIDLVLQETPTTISDEAQCQKVLWGAVKSHWEHSFPRDDMEVSQWIQRVRCLRVWMPDLDLPILDQEALERVALELCQGKRSLVDVQQAPWLDWLGGLLTTEQRRALEREAPSKIQVPSGSMIRIEYEEGKAPVLSVKIQEVFSWQQTPRLAAGRVALRMHLLSPGMRPQQVTEDLASFWRTGYAEVRKELKRRYPKHSWPEDPLTAAPTRR